MTVMEAPEAPLKPSKLWLSTVEMAAEIGISRRTLDRLKAAGYFKEGHHFRRSNPTSARSTHLWHRHRVALKVGAV